MYACRARDAAAGDAAPFARKGYARRDLSSLVVMQVGRYDFGWNTVLAMRRMVKDAARVKIRGIPRLPHEHHSELAAAVLRGNARDVFRAGHGHFHVMWPTDFGKAFGGALHAVPHDYLGGLLARMTRTGARLGHVPTCFTPRGHYDLPWKRADNVPWLIHMVERLDDAELVESIRGDLEKVYADWVAHHVDPANGLMHHHVTGDWMDTVPRPSSTYNNLCAVRAYRAADALGIESAPTFATESERALIDTRWSGDFLKDHAGDGADYLSADANAFALYLEVLPESYRHRIADAIESSGLCDPIPMRTRVGEFARHELPLLTRFVPSYHTTTWLHLGLIYMNGLKRIGRDYSRHLEVVDGVVRRHGNFLETLTGSGDPLHLGLMTTEYGFGMSAGQYLELVGPSQPAVSTDAVAVEAAVARPAAAPAVDA